MEATLASAARARSQHTAPVNAAKYGDDEDADHYTAEGMEESGGVEMPVVPAPTVKAVVGVKSGEGG